jgi:hypothetical protein
MTSGDRSLDTLAQSQLRATRRDPRADRDRAIIDDFFVACEEAARMRRLSLWGLCELERSLDREETSLGLTRGDPALSRDARQALDAAWERSELAKAESLAETPALNVAALILMVGALDTLVEDLTPSVRDMVVRTSMRRLLDEAIAQAKPPVELTDDQRRTIENAAVAAAYESLPELPRLQRGGVRRYERLLEKVGLGAPSDRPIPRDLDVALAEVIAIRNVVVHRASRAEEKSLRAARSLGLTEGQFVRVSNAQFRTYSAAIHAYGVEVADRLLGKTIGTKPTGDLLRWRDDIQVND